MKLNELRNLVKEVIKEQQEGDFTQHTNRSVVSFFKLMLRNPFYQSDLAELYQMMLDEDMSTLQAREAAAAAFVKKHSDLGNNDARRVFTPGMINFHRRGLFGASDVPKKDDLLAAAQSATQARKDAEAAAQAERNKIKVAKDPKSVIDSQLKRRGSSWAGEMAPEGSTEEEAKAFFRDSLQGIPIWTSEVFVTPKGQFFIVYEYATDD